MAYKYIHVYIIIYNIYFYGKKTLSKLGFLNSPRITIFKGKEKGAYWTIINCVNEDEGRKSK